MKAGTVYKNTTEIVLNDLDYEPNELKRNIKSQIKQLMWAGVIALDKELEPWYIHMPGNIDQIIFESQTPILDLKSIAIAVDNRRLNDRDKAVLAINIMEQIHDYWVKSNQQFFFSMKSKKKNRLYLFMPFYLLGFATAQRYLDYINSLLRIISLSTERYLIKQVYLEKQRLFLLSYNHIHGIQELYAFVRWPAYHALSDDIIMALKEPNIAELITEQIVHRNEHYF